MQLLVTPALCYFYYYYYYYYYSFYVGLRIDFYIEQNKRVILLLIII
jgi:hypothetical protein